MYLLLPRNVSETNMFFNKNSYYSYWLIDTVNTYIISMNKFGIY